MLINQDERAPGIDESACVTGSPRKARDKCASLKIPDGIIVISLCNTFLRVEYRYVYYRGTYELHSYPNVSLIK